MSQLAEMNCDPCHEGGEPLSGIKLEALINRVDGWELVDSRQIRKSFTFADFAEALDFGTRVGHLAEQQGHHPDICFAWGRATVTTWTHKVDGLTENDFILAAKVDQLA